MRIVDLITKKREGKALNKAEQEFLLGAYLNNTMPDYQMSAFLMAVVFKGMETDELAHFTKIMANSGNTITVPKSKRFIIDKHSTGGVGDKTSIALAPLLAAMGMGVAKLSGRGLGHTGGTIDKFEAIPNFKFMTDIKKMLHALDSTGIGLLGATDTMVPLDKRLYALRDVTATVQSIPLIASSIISKKLAVESDAILLDVKVGNGAFMQSIEQAKELAQTMVDIGKGVGRNIACMLTNMNQPLGFAVGNSLEFIEAVETLKGNGPPDFTELILLLAGAALFLKGDVKNLEEGTHIAAAQISSTKKDMHDKNSSLAHLAAFIELSGGNKQVVYDYSLLPHATYTKEVLAKGSGYVAGYDTSAIGNAAMVLGAGRETKDDIINPAVGLVVHKKQGDKVAKGEPLATVHYDEDAHLETSIKMIQNAITVSETPTPTLKLLLDFIY